ncbi:MAG: hypothetical protein ABI759_13920 [Candidatus Solibacter sp.]
MKRISSGITLALLICAAAPAATVNTTLTVTNATLTIGLGTSLNGPATLTTIGSGTLSAPSLTADSSGDYSGNYTITLAGADRITGVLKVPGSAISAALAGGAITGSATVTGGAGTYAGATGNFANLSGTGSLNLSTGAITLSFSGAGTITTGGTGGGGTPTPNITDVLDAGSYTKNIARGSIFVVKGSLLSAAGYTAMSFPLPPVSSGVKITFTPAAGGSGTDAYLVYLYNLGGVNQLAAVLPSTVTTGNYNVTVTNGAVSAPFAVQVVERKVGLITADGSGSGLAVLQNYISASQLDIDRFTTFASSPYTYSPAKPGQIVIAWVTGLGGVAGGDNVASPGFDFNTSLTIRVLVGGATITPLYAGRAPGLAGADQINFQLPANIATGCTVPFQVSVNGQLSNTSFIAIAPDASASACVQPGYTTDQLKKFDSGGTYTVGGFQITQFGITASGVSIKSNSVSGAFVRISGFQLSSAPATSTSTQVGSCTVSQSTTTGSSTSSGTVTTLDAGNITVSGPAGSSLNNTPLTKLEGTYSLTNTEGLGVVIPGQVAFTLPAGTYTLNGAGGVDVGNFTASVTVGSPLTLTTPLPDSVTRSAGVTVNWTGGNASDVVQITGGGSTSTGTGAARVTTTTSFICLTTAGVRTFTVPPAVLTQLPATDNGSLFVSSGAQPLNFTASLKAGGSIDAGSFGSFVGVGAAPAYR